MIDITKEVYRFLTPSYTFKHTLYIDTFIDGNVLQGTVVIHFDGDVYIERDVGFEDIENHRIIKIDNDLELCDPDGNPLPYTLDESIFEDFYL